ncbi:clostri-philic family protein [Clostridium uliginosum]|uniref:Uncharacterized protein n=1 Tax=Clostridium uliginosum TaxID=119641 RepID=A0A1I1QQA9_9CLOT|nr:clostri-philic family protein [Clostridium uliginosum]SFD24304.1 hypothetical protein SAMN05421842_12648 [Clostridium uliginosum]
MTNKEGAINPMQKGERRQRIHGNQNNVGNDKNEPEYKNFAGEPIKK